MSRNISNSIYTTGSYNAGGPIYTVRTGGEIHTKSWKFDYTGNSVDTANALETSWSNTSEQYLTWHQAPTVDRPFPLVLTRRIGTVTESNTDSIDGSQNHQWLTTYYKFDNDGVMQQSIDDNHDGIIQANERTGAVGYFYSHSGFSSIDGQPFDTTQGVLDQAFEVLYVSPSDPGFPPSLRLGVSRLKTATTDSRNVSRDGSVSVSHGTVDYTNAHWGDRDANGRLIGLRLTAASGQTEQSSRDPFGKRDQRNDHAGLHHSRQPGEGRQVGFRNLHRQRGSLQHVAGPDGEQRERERSARPGSSSVDLGTAGSHCESPFANTDGSKTRQRTTTYNAYNKYGRLKLEFDANGNGNIDDNSTITNGLYEKTEGTGISCGGATTGSSAIPVPSFPRRCASPAASRPA